MKFFRAAILHFLQDPYQAGARAHEYYPDGLLAVDEGHVARVGHYDKMAKAYGKKITPKNLFDFSGKLIMPGFIDTHVHYPQIEIMGSFGKQLLEWLENYTFPAEEKFADKDYATKVAEIFLHELLINGTTTAMVYPTVHPSSVDAFLNRQEKSICA